MPELTEFQQRACAAGVIKMMNAKHFSICDLDTLAKTMGREEMLGGKDYAALRAVHCVDWADLGPELTTMVREKCFEILGLPQAAIDSVCKREPEAKPHEPARHLRLAFWKRG